MGAQLRIQSGRPSRGSVNEEGARIDPIVYLAEGRRRQARAMAAALAAGSRALRWGLTGLAALIRQHLLEPLARWAERRRAIGRLAELDDRLLADIGLRRGEIEFAVDGLLADPRVTRRAPPASANSNRASVRAQQGRAPDRAA